MSYDPLTKDKRQVKLQMIEILTNHQMSSFVPGNIYLDFQGYLCFQ